MANTSVVTQMGSTAHNGVPVPPVPTSLPAADGPSGIALAALVLSVLTLLKTLYGDWRAWRNKKGVKFEADYGTPIRTGLRAYEKTIFTLRTFGLPNARSIDELKTEIETERAKWIEAADEVTRLLREADDSGLLVYGGWAQLFTDYAHAAENDMLEMTEPATATVDDLRAVASHIQNTLAVGVAEVRSAMRLEAQSYDRAFRRR